jgi:hypothetical protein
VVARDGRWPLGRTCAGQAAKGEHAYLGGWEEGPDAWRIETATMLWRPGTDDGSRVTGSGNEELWAFVWLCSASE